MDSLELFTGHLFYSEQPESRAEGSSCTPELRPYGQMNQRAYMPPCHELPSSVHGGSCALVQSLYPTSQCLLLSLLLPCSVLSTMFCAFAFLRHCTSCLSHRGGLCRQGPAGRVCMQGTMCVGTFLCGRACRVDSCLGELACMGVCACRVVTCVGALACMFSLDQLIVSACFHAVPSVDPSPSASKNGGSVSLSRPQLASSKSVFYLCPILCSFIRHAGPAEPPVPGQQPPVRV